MLFKSSVNILIYSCILLILYKSINSNKNFFNRSKRDAVSYEVKCAKRETAVDAVYFFNTSALSRKKRFVLFPEFVNYKDDWNYIQNPKEILYWIANFYPDKINSEYVHAYIKTVIQQINLVIDDPIIIRTASDPGEANFHFNFFDYSKCPTDDPSATINNIQLYNELDIYSAELTRKSRYRANGGLTLVGPKKISTMKFNTQQHFIHSDDFVYDPLIYTCNDELNECDIDLYWALLHETLHGFGIEHTTNAEQPIAPNSRMQAVMHFAVFRELCHDDIRAIRKVYNLPVKRENAVYDDTCRRDFPMNKLQKLMYKLGKILSFLSKLIPFISVLIFILTLIYILIRYLLRGKVEKQRSTISTSSLTTLTEKPIMKPKRNLKPHGYLWHDEMMN